MFSKSILIITSLTVMLSIQGTSGLIDDSQLTEEIRTLQSLHDMAPIYKPEGVKLPMSAQRETKALSPMAEMTKDHLKDSKMVETIYSMDPLSLSAMSEVPDEFLVNVEDQIVTQKLLDRAQFSFENVKEPLKKISMGEKIEQFLEKYYTPDSFYSPFYQLD